MTEENARAAWKDYRKRARLFWLSYELPAIGGLVGAYLLLPGLVFCVLAFGWMVSFIVANS